MKKLIIFSLFLSVSAAYAAGEVYECFDASGHRILSDTKLAAPGTKCDVINLPPLPQVSSTKVESTSKNTKAPLLPKKLETRKKASDTQSAKKKMLEEQLNKAKNQLEKFQKDLEMQKSVRYGNERNYQRKLERVKPYEVRYKNQQDLVDSLNKQLSGLK